MRTQAIDLLTPGVGETNGSVLGRDIIGTLQEPDEPRK